jgi:TetR/AcrR family transcriptional regulator, regulator of mycofactocin system
MVLAEVEAVALRLFEERGFADVTVEDIASEAKISARTFYRYLPTKEDVLQVRIDRRTEDLRAALMGRPNDEPPLHSLRVAVELEVSAEDPELLARWMAVIVASPILLRSVVGGLHLKVDQMMAEFFGSRLGLPSDALVPRVLAASAGGVINAAQTYWFLNGGDLAETISESLEVLERGIGTAPGSWAAPIGVSDAIG